MKVKGLGILEHVRKTSDVWYLVDRISISILTERFLNYLGLKYTLKYKFLQDILNYLYNISDQGGNNSNPIVSRFRHALRQLMFRNSIQASKV